MNTLKGARISVLFAVIMVLAGCANGFHDFYHPYPNVDFSRFEPPPPEPRLITGLSSAQETIRKMFEDGYVPIGYSAFVGAAAKTELALRQAKQVGASLVVVGSKYQSTVSGLMPITLPTSTTSYSSGVANAYGSGGYASGTYSGTTTTYGTETTYIPYSIDRYDQGAIYFGTLKHQGFGILFNTPTDALRQAAGTNQGMLITTIRKGSPAFFADVLPGDLLLSIDGTPVYDGPTMNEAYSHASGRKVDFVLFRSGGRLTKAINLPAGDW